MFLTVRRSAALALVAYILPAQVDTHTNSLGLINASSGRHAATGEERHPKIDVTGLYSLPSAAPGTHSASGNLRIGGQTCVSNRV